MKPLRRHALPCVHRTASVASSTAALALAGALSLAFAPAHAAPGADSAYATDPQHTWVNDRTAEPIKTVNNIMCYMSSMKPAALVNQGPYAALVNGAKCESDGSGSDATNTGTQYQRVTVDASRGSETDPMRVKVWVPNDHEDEGVSGDIYVNVTASKAPDDTNPNGEFVVDYCAPMPDGSCFMNGKLEGLATGLRFVEREMGRGGGGGVGTLRLFVARNGDAGAGAVARDVPGVPSESLTYQFAYDANYFRRVKLGGEDACFDRSLANGKISAFRYGLYDAAGARVERSGGFPVTTQVGGQTVHGYAGYWGLNFPPSVSVADGATVTKENFDKDGGGTSYTLAKMPGRLMKFTKSLVPLAKAKNIPISFGIWNGVTDATAAAIQPGASGMMFRGRSVEVSWDATVRRFMITAVQTCSPSGCGNQPVSPAVPLSSGDMAMYARGLQGWSQALGGDVSVPETLAAAIANDDASAVDGASLVVRVSDMVYPGEGPAQLYCVNNCTTAAGLAALQSGAASNPFDGTQDHFMNVEAAVGYTRGPDGKLSTAGAPVLWPAGYSAQQAGMWGNGVRTGKLLPNASDFQCPAPYADKYCAGRADEAEVFYAWETGPNAWNGFAGLKDAAGAYLRFDAPLQVAFNVPDRAEFGQYRGTTLRLQYNGFGDLFGIPASCVNSVTNEPVPCEGASGPDVRWVPAFTIPDTLSEGVVTDGQGASYYVKWLNREVRFSQVSSGLCSGLTVGSLASLPDGSNLVNPSRASDPTYIGTKPEVTAAPRVIDGVVKY